MYNILLPNMIYGALQMYSYPFIFIKFCYVAALC